MWPSILLYASLATSATGLLSLAKPLRFLRIRTRRAGAAVTIAGAVGVAAALMIPTSEKRAGATRTRLDEFMPVWQFDETHTIEINASPQRVFEAIHGVTARDIKLFRTLTAIRRMGRSAPEGILNAPKEKSILDVATSTTFIYLADDAPREVVVGTVIIPPPGMHHRSEVTPELFKKVLPPGAALATMNFFVMPEGSGRSIVTTETRVFANDDSAKRRFTVYWRFIQPGSDIIRRMWLRAIKQRAEKVR